MCSRHRAGVNIALKMRDNKKCDVRKRTVLLISNEISNGWQLGTAIARL